jgi:guanine deaminase
MTEAGELLRAPLFHTPRNPFFESGALVSIPDGGLLIRAGKIAACGEYSQPRAMHSDAASRDLRGAFLLPGLIDAHVHFPQTRVLGSLGRSLLDWLEQCALPEEVRMSDVADATRVAREFVHSLVTHGTTSAMAFGAYFSAATAALFEAAAASGSGCARAWFCRIAVCARTFM